MSQRQLDTVIQDIQGCFGAWNTGTSLSQMREEWDALFSMHPSGIGATRQIVDAGGVRAEWIVAPGASDERVVMYVHGGGYVFGSPRSHGALAEQLSHDAQASVLFVDYRLAPEHPFPAAIEDALGAYRWLLAQGHSPKRIAIAGDSAGGGLSLSTMVSLKEASLPQPACSVLMSPWVDLECSGETLISKAAEDPYVQRDMLAQLVGMYLPKGNVRDPLASPLFADLSGLPPTLIQVGSRETLLDDAVRVAGNARRAGVTVELDICQGMIHVFQLFCVRLDEGRAAVERLGAHVRRHTG